MRRELRGEPGGDPRAAGVVRRALLCDALGLQPSEVGRMTAAEVAAWLMAAERAAAREASFRKSLLRALGARVG